MVSRTARRLDILCSLKKFSVGARDLVEIYKVFIRPLVEFGVPVWGSGIIGTQSDEIERLQKRVLRFIAYPPIQSYMQQLTHFGIHLLSERRNELLLHFGLCLLKSEGHHDIFPSTRQSVSRYNIQLRNAQSIDLPQCKSQSYKNSTIPF